MTICSPSSSCYHVWLHQNLNQVMAALQQLQLENEILRQSLRELQSGTPRNPPRPSHNQCRLYLRGFMNQIRLIIRLSPNGMLATFLGLGFSARFSPGQRKRCLHPIKTSSPLFENFTAFIEVFEATFGKTNQKWTILTKIYFPTRLTSNLGLRLRVSSDCLRC